ncbi:hypothetical protein MUP77_09405 [Candidatus Bathyarchaeota archaeon]|nr:hypothetical protein [Candidatus Bathyarchaeota archaeon]
MSEEKKLLEIWVPKQVFELWNIDAVASNCGSFEHLLLDILSANLEALKEIAGFAEEYGSYTDYAEDLRGHRTLNDKEIEDVILCAKQERRLEDGRKLLAEGVDAKKLDEAQKTLKKCLDAL